MPHCGAGNKLGWSEPVEGHVWSRGVVVDPPIFDEGARLFEAREQVLVKAFVAEATDEALGEAVLHRFAGRDVVPFDLALIYRFAPTTAMGKSGTVGGRVMTGCWEPPVSSLTRFAT